MLEIVETTVVGVRDCAKVVGVEVDGLKEPEASLHVRTYRRMSAEVL